MAGTLRKDAPKQVTMRDKSIYEQQQSLRKHHIIITVKALNEKKETILLGNLTVCPPYLPEAMDGHALDHF
ncbi:hypothetical protein [Metabacillus sp. RGM 3146]|uniref:hypothetical protein n=1 Tax=Metabacillus sp. RGM 3146 TaxID=3401092 RepID=UPI003B9BB4B9